MASLLVNNCTLFFFKWWQFSVCESAAEVGSFKSHRNSFIPALLNQQNKLLQLSGQHSGSEYSNSDMLFLQHGIIIHLVGLIFLHNQFIVLHSAVSHPSLWIPKQIHNGQRNNCSDLHSNKSLSKLKFSQQNPCKVTWEYPSKVTSSLLTIFYPTGNQDYLTLLKWSFNNWCYLIF